MTRLRVASARWYATFPCQGGCRASEVKTAWAPRHPRSGGAHLHRRPCTEGVILAFAWNMAGSYGPEMPQAGPGLAPTVGAAVDQSADQAWASVTPTSTRFPDRRASPPAGSRGGAGTGCSRARSSRMVRTASAVDSAHASACSSPRRFPEAAGTGSALSASTTAWSARRKSGHSSTLVVAVPNRGNRR